MGMNHKPDRDLVSDRRFPVRLTVLAHGSITDHANELTSHWLKRHLREGGYAVSRADTWSGRRVVHIHLMSVFDAAALLLACPHLQLHGEAYSGPVR